MTQTIDRPQPVTHAQLVTAELRAQQIERPQPAAFSPEQVDLIKNTVAVGTSDLELALFLEVCRTTGLNPFQRQIYAVVRKGKTKQGNQWVETSKMVIQTGIDGYRLIAARSGVHMGTTDAEFGPLKDGYPESARVIVRKLVHGQVVDFPATARWAEYVQTKAEYKNGSATGVQIVSDMWAKMPHTMLGKCAEALALRKAFPAELSGVYSDIEMQQADSEPAQAGQQARTVDVTREVAQASGATLQQVAPARSEALLAWEEKIAKAGTRLTELGLRDQARAVMAQYPNWKTEVSAAAAVYESMKQIGAQHAKETAARPALDIEDGLMPEQSEPVDVEALITEAQRGRLMGHVKRTGIPDETEARARFYSWFKPDIVPVPTRTTQLTEQQAGGLIALLTELDNDAAQHLGQQFNTADLPF